MTNDNYTTIRAPEDAVETARDQKEAAGRTWGEQIVRPDGDVGDLDPFGGEVPTVTTCDYNPEEIVVQLLQDTDLTPDFPTADVEAALRRVLRDELADGALDGGRV